MFLFLPVFNKCIDVFVKYLYISEQMYFKQRQNNLVNNKNTTALHHHIKNSNNFQFSFLKYYLNIPTCT